jgi:hypothetical protein
VLEFLANDPFSDADVPDNNDMMLMVTLLILESTKSLLKYIKKHTAFHNLKPLAYANQFCILPAMAT